MRAFSDGERSALADGHGFAGTLAMKLLSVNGAIRDGNLPGADHLILHGETANAAVADGDEEGFGGDGRAMTRRTRSIASVEWDF